jgi:hypothetical protein
MKKGESALTFVASLILLSIILTIFYILFLQASFNQTKISIQQISISDVQLNLINYLRTPLQDRSTIYDLIIKSYYNNDYNELEKVTGEVFNKVYEKEKCPLWNVYGEIDKKKFFDYESSFDIRKYTPEFSLKNLFNSITNRFFLSTPYLGTRSSSLNLISPNSNRPIKIILVEGCINE